MLYLKQFQNWCKAHWKWLTLTAMFVIAYVLGKNQAKNLLKMAEFERTQYKEQNKNLEQQVKNKAAKDEEAIRKYEKTIELLKNERDERIKSFKDMENNEVLEELGIKKQ
tara:strand:- start:1544 stop:1873 length:330 start_codon:yes stop_codon:yes gene_type:complete